MAFLVGSLQHGQQISFGFDNDNDFRNQPVKAGIGAIRQTAQAVSDDLMRRQYLRKSVDYLLHNAPVCMICSAGSSNPSDWNWCGMVCPLILLW
jgi:hypothetical protein